MCLKVQEYRIFELRAHCLIEMVNKEGDFDDMNIKTRAYTISGPC